MPDAKLQLMNCTTSASLGKLDSSLKRHQTLLTRLRSSLHTPANIPGILSDIKTLALEKYIEEAVGATLEGLGRCKTGAEVQGAVEVRFSPSCYRRNRAAEQADQEKAQASS